MKPFSKYIIRLENVKEVVDKIVVKLADDVLKNLKRSGGVVGISGGIDSAVCLALSVKAFGPDKTVAIMMPDKDSSPESETLARELAAKFSVTSLFLENITDALNGLHCY